jgi:hypothetical protein
MTSNRECHLPILIPLALPLLPLFQKGSYEPIAHRGGCQSMDIHFYELFYNFLFFRLERDQNRRV